MTGSPGEELVEEVDADGTVLRVVDRAEMRAGNLRHRNVAVVVRRPGGAVVVHQRADWKDVHPSMWDVAFGGVPGVGEGDVDAAVRELAEEAGLEVDPDELVDRGAADHDDELVRWVGRLYELVDDREIAPADGEVVAVDEVPIDELENWTAATDVCPDAAWAIVPAIMRWR